jgi:butyryl-CoA dehydrogenase
VQPLAAELDETGRFPTELVKQMAELGFMGMMVGDDWGGAGLDAVSYVLAMEEISRGCASTGVIMSVNNSLVCDPLSKFATDAQKEKYLKPLASGQKLGCFCLSEPGTGSDAASPRRPTRAGC